MSMPSERSAAHRRQRGLSLIELVVFIVIVGIAVTGVLAALMQAIRSSADPMLNKQALAIAESLLEEIELQPFTYCDPDDAKSGTATGPGGCAATVEGLGPEAGESRYDAGSPFDNVNDYNGFSMAGIRDITNSLLGGLGAFNATVTVAPADLGGITAISGDALKINVTVTGPNHTVISLDGYRARYAPNI